MTASELHVSGVAGRQRTTSVEDHEAIGSGAVALSKQRQGGTMNQRARRVGFTRRLIVGLCLMAPVMAPAVAGAGVPSPSERVDAKRFARTYWEDHGYETDCRHVRVRVTRRLDSNTAAAVISGTCTIWLSRYMDWTHHGRRDSWWQVCATMTHEYGHLPGISRPHSRNPNSIMAPFIELNQHASWWPYFPDCRYEGDDQDDDGLPDW